MKENVISEEAARDKFENKGLKNTNTKGSTSNASHPIMRTDQIYFGSFVQGHWRGSDSMEIQRVRSSIVPFKIISYINLPSSQLDKKRKNKNKIV